MEVTFDVKMTPKIMYDFLMNHTYKSPTGVLGVLFGLFAFVILGVTWGKAEGWQSILYGLFGFWFILYLPVNLYLRSARQVKMNPTFQKPITYTVTQEGITTSQEKQKATMKWEDMMVVKETKKSILVYTGKRSCVVLPKESMGEKYQDVVALIRRCMEPGKVKIKEA